MKFNQTMAWGYFVGFGIALILFSNPLDYTEFYVLGIIWALTSIMWGFIGGHLYD